MTEVSESHNEHDAGHDHTGHNHGIGSHGHSHGPKDFGFAFALGTALNIGFVVI